MKRKLTALIFASVAFAGCSDHYKTSELDIWSTESDSSSKEVLESVAEQLEQKHKNIGLDVRITHMGWGATSENLLNARNSGDLPDVSHVQPFMAYSLYEDQLLLPISDVISDIESINGPIFTAVRDLQKFGDENQHYGIAYAVGSTFWSIRTDLIPDSQNIEEITTWSDYLNFAVEVNKTNPEHLKVTIPGGSPFFVDQLYAEMIANSGGRIFDENRCPLLTSESSIKTLQFFKDLKDKNLLSHDWSTQTYQDQFVKLANGEVFSVPVTYARASKKIQEIYEASPDKTKADANDKEIFWLNQPTQKASHISLGTIDAEPWVVFSVSDRRLQSDGTRNSQLAKEFLQLFYEESNYLNYTQSVPIHLTPIFENIASSDEYSSSIGNFSSWNIKTIDRLKEGTIRPILMPDISPSGKSLPFLLEFSRVGILSGAVSDVLESNIPVIESAERAQQRALQIVRRSKSGACPE